MTELAVIGLIRPVAKPADMLALHDELAAIIGTNLEAKLDYGTVPGTGDKPALLKPGAEKLCLAFSLVPEFVIVEQEKDHDRQVRWVKKKKVWNNAYQGDKTFRWDMEDGVSLGLYRYVVRCDLKRGDRIVGSCVGVCSSLESKYIDRPRDSENTIMKMAQKRAMVGATLGALALSNRFTQDIEDLPSDTVVELKKDATVSNIRKAPTPPPAAAATVAEPLTKPTDVYIGEYNHQKPVLGRWMKLAKIPQDRWDECSQAMIEGKVTMGQLSVAVYEWLDMQSGAAPSDAELDAMAMSEPPEDVTMGATPEEEARDLVGH